MQHNKNSSRKYVIVKFTFFIRVIKKVAMHANNFYKSTSLLNNLNSESEILKHVIANIETSTLLGLKRIMKNYFIDKYSYYCHIPDCYICDLT